MTTELADDPGPREVERVMEALVYEHLIDLVDFDRMADLERVLIHELGELSAHGQLPALEPMELAEHAAAILERAWARVVRDPRRYLDFSGEWQPDEDCELCQALAAKQVPS